MRILLSSKVDRTVNNISAGSAPTAAVASAPAGRSRIMNCLPPQGKKLKLFFIPPFPLFAIHLPRIILVAPNTRSF